MYSIVSPDLSDLPIFVRCIRTVLGRLVVCVVLFLGVLLGIVIHSVFWGELVGHQSRNPPPCPEELCATIDTGCQRMAIGLETLQRLDQSLPDGFQSYLTKQEHRFRSVHGTSTTRYTAAIPTSLGNKGSVLRPAIFDTPESRSAPFLISIPFLMFCKSGLVLDPEPGFSLEIKRFGCRVPCHLGPSGALRVPLGMFSADMVRRI